MTDEELTRIVKQIVSRYKEKNIDEKERYPKKEGGDKKQHKMIKISNNVMKEIKRKK